MEIESDRHRRFTRRALMLGGLQALLAAGLVGRMYDLSIVKGQKFAVLADENRLSLRLIAPRRGRILDRFGEEIAGNRQDLRVVLVPEQVQDLDETLALLGQWVGLKDGDRARILKQIARQRAFVPVTVAENLDWETFARVNVESPRLSGVQPAAGLSRYYPDGAAFAHVVGHVGAVSESDLDDDPVLQLPGFKIGKAGVEQALEDRLRGAAGTSRIEVNALGRVIREVARQESQPGGDVRLSLSAALQRRITARMGEESASAVVIDVQYGDILALASMPAFDPNAFSVGISRDYWRSLLADPRTPLVNKCVGGLYPPGSTFKMVVALAALEAGVADPAEEFYCSGRMRLGDRFFHCWKHRGHGAVDMHRSLVESCDIYYYHLALRVGAEPIARMANRLGLGQGFDLPLLGVRDGLVPTPGWKRAVHGTPWTGGETLNLSIGQGYLLTTPLQLAVMTARLASGRAVEPQLVAGQGRFLPPALDIAPQHLALMRKAMDDTVNDQHGTAYAARIKTPERAMAGKTGTAQVRRISLAERETGVLKNEDLPWRERDHALYVGYANVEAPRYAVAVVVEHGGGGASAAAPLGRDILDWVQQLDPLGVQRGDVADAGVDREVL